MTSEQNPDLNTFMSVWLKSLIDAMVEVGVTPKSEIKRVKALKKLWKSDSFQRLKYILKEPPIQESRVRPQEIPLYEDQDDEIESDASVRESEDEVVIKAKAEYTIRKEELIDRYEKCLLSDLTKLKQKTEEITASLLEKATQRVEAAETGRLDQAIENTIKDMRMRIKCFKKVKKRQLKMEVESDRKKVMEQLTNYLNEDIKRRNYINERLLVKKLSFGERNAERIIADELDQKRRRDIVALTRRLEYRKNKVIAKQEKDLRDLKLKLEASYDKRLKSSENRVKTEIKQQIKNIPKSNSEETEEQCYIAQANQLRQELSTQGWDLGSTNKDLAKLTGCLFSYYQILIDSTGTDKDWSNNYLLSFESLLRQKDAIKQCFLKKQPDRILWKVQQKTDQSNENQAQLFTSSSLSGFFGSCFHDKVMDCDDGNSSVTLSTQMKQNRSMDIRADSALNTTENSCDAIDGGVDQRVKYDQNILDEAKLHELAVEIIDKRLNNVFFLNI